MDAAQGNGYTISFVPWNSPESETVKSIRFKVFVEEQKVPSELELDEVDADALHALAKNGDGIACGTARMFQADENPSRLIIGRMAVLSEFRCSGCGNAIITALINEARRQGATSIELSAQCRAVPFYRKYGFVAEGDIYDDAGIEHQKMVLKDVSAQDAR